MRDFPQARFLLTFSTRSQDTAMRSISALIISKFGYLPEGGTVFNEDARLPLRPVFDDPNDSTATALEADSGGKRLFHISHKF